MLKKRLMGVVTIKQGWAVQSIGYKTYLPLGRPEYIVENLERWGVDEIALQVIDRTEKALGPDFELLEKLNQLNLTTPICYAGGINTEEQAIRVIQTGAERIMLDQLLWTHPNIVSNIASKLGAQALIACIPTLILNHQVAAFDYLKRQHRADSSPVAELVKSKAISEIMLIDKEHEGLAHQFDARLLGFCTDMEVPLILFGGISCAHDASELLLQDKVSAIGIGNFLNYQEQAVQKIKNQLTKGVLRASAYHKDQGGW